MCNIDSHAYDPQCSCIDQLLQSDFVALGGSLHSRPTVATCHQVSSTCLSMSTLSNDRFFHRPNMPRPIRVNLALPITFLTCCLVLVLLPSFSEPMNLIIGVGITLSGVPVYYVCVVWNKNKNNRSRNFLMQWIERGCQIMFNAAFVDCHHDRKNDRELSDMQTSIVDEKNVSN